MQPTMQLVLRLFQVGLLEPIGVIRIIIVILASVRGRGCMDCLMYIGVSMINVHGLFDVHRCEYDQRYYLEGRYHDFWYTEASKMQLQITAFETSI